MRILRLLTPLVLLSVLLVPAQPGIGRSVVHAAALPTIQVAPNALLVGAAAVPVAVSGSGFTPGATIALSADWTTTPYTTTADLSGAFGSGASTPAVTFAQVAFNAVAVHTVNALDSHGKAATAKLYAASLTLSSPAGPVGAEIAISGAGFLLSQPLTVQVGGSQVLGTATGPTGAFGPLFFAVPALPVGVYSLVVSSGSGNGAIAVTTTFTILPQPTLSVTPTSVQAGAPFTISGANYPYGATLLVKLDSATLGGVPVGPAGVIGPAQFVVPSSTASGQHTVAIVDGTGHVLASTTLSVFAGPVSLTLAPNSGPPGLQVTLTGSGFSAGETVQVTINTAPVASTAAYLNGQIAVTFTLPSSLPAGPVAVQATGLTSHASGYVIFTVATPTLTLSAGTGSPGASITATGHGFGAGELVTISFAGQPVASQVADLSGTFSVPFTVPSGYGSGTVTVTATGAGSRLTASASFVLVATRLVLSSASAQAGATITLTGSGYGAGEPVTITVPSYTLVTVVADGQGGFVATATVPEVSYTATVQVTITATGVNTQRAATATLTVTPLPARLTLSAAAVFQGGSVTVNGNGYAPNEAVVVAVNGQGLVNAQAGSQGTFSANLSLPGSVQPGTVSVSAQGLHSQKVASSTLVVLARPAASLSLSPQAGIVGSEVTISGAGFVPGESIALTVDGHDGFTVTAGPSGTFSARMTVVPTLVGGAHLIGATGSQSQIKAEASFTVQAGISVTPQSVTAGAPVRIEGSGFAASETVSLSLDSAQIALATTDANGHFTLNTVLPAPAVSGPARLLAVGLTGHGSATASVVRMLPAAVGSTSWYFAGARTDQGFASQIALLNPSTKAVAGTITVYYGDGRVSVHSFTLRPTARGTFDLGTLTGATARVSVLVHTDQPVAAALTQDRASEDMTATAGVAVPAQTWYFAEGYTGLTFQEALDLFNPGSQPARVQVQWPLFNGRAPIMHEVVLAAHARVTIPVNQYVDRTSHATVVTADRPIVAGRTMLFGARLQGAHATAGLAAPSTNLSFAEGSTANGFEEFLAIFNPQSSGTAYVKVGIFDRNGRQVATRSVVVPAMQRGTIKVNDLVKDSSIAATLSSNLPVVAERALYFGAPNGDRADGTVVFGQASAARGWAFAAGDTSAGCADFALLFNQQSSPISVRAVWYTDSGQVVERTFTVASMARLTIDVTRDVPELGHCAHGLVVESASGAPFLAEMAMYENNMANGSAMVGTPLS